jgi:hypothetical protein
MATLLKVLNNLADIKSAGGCCTSRQNLGPPRKSSLKHSAAVERILPPFVVGETACRRLSTGSLGSRRGYPATTTPNGGTDGRSRTDGSHEGTDPRDPAREPDPQVPGSSLRQRPVGDGCTAYHYRRRRKVGWLVDELARNSEQLASLDRSIVCEALEDSRGPCHTN